MTFFWNREKKLVPIKLFGVFWGTKWQRDKSVLYYIVIMLVHSWAKVSTNIGIEEKPFAEGDYSFNHLNLQLLFVSLLSSYLLAYLMVCCMNR
jgi:hypothetical protein